MYTLIVLITLLGVPGKSIEVLNIPGFATRIECVNSRILLNERFAGDQVLIESLCLYTPS